MPSFRPRCLKTALTAADQLPFSCFSAAFQLLSNCPSAAFQMPSSCLSFNTTRLLSSGIIFTHSCAYQLTKLTPPPPPPPPSHPMSQLCQTILTSRHPSGPQLWLACPALHAVAPKLRSPALHAVASKLRSPALHAVAPTLKGPALHAVQPPVSLLKPRFACCTGAGGNGAIIHYRAEKGSCKKVDKDTLLLLDSGGQFDCGTTDVTRTMHFGTPTDHQRTCFTRVLQVLPVLRSLYIKQCHCL